MNEYQPTLCQEDQTVAGGATEGALGTIRSLWRWRYSNLMDDVTKGDFAEWLVAKLLGIPVEPGGYISGANYDFNSSEHIKIEVKSSSYWQSWKLYDAREGRWRSREELARLPRTTDRNVRFSGLWRREIYGSEVSKAASFKADIYIFAFDKEVDPLEWNALDLDQWEFFALTREHLVEEKAKRDAQYTQPPKGFALSLGRLRELWGGRGMTAGELQKRAASILRGDVILPMRPGIEAKPSGTSAPSEVRP